MNYHSDEWIMSKVQEHYDEATTLVDPNHIVGIFYQGSGNYGLDYEDSDVDTKCIVTPTFEEIALAKKPLSTTHIRANDEHIDFKDIRLYIQTFRKQNLNFLEILYTPYFLIGTPYYASWQKLVTNREKITHYDRVRSVKSMMGIASEKYHAMEHRYPSRIEWLDKFGYDPKQLHHLLRVGEYLDRYIEGKPYGDCLLTQTPEYLKDIKKGCLSLENARILADSAYYHIHKKCDAFIEKYKDEPIDEEIDKLFDDVCCEIMEISIRRDFNANTR